MWYGCCLVRFGKQCNSLQFIFVLTLVNLIQFTVVTLSNIIGTLTCFVALWLPCSSTKVIFVLASIFTVLSSYVVALASMSPTPPLHGTTLGSFIVVSTATKKLSYFCSRRNARLRIQSDKFADIIFS